jgi:hypothetical protein
MDFNLSVPATIDIQDDPLPNGRRNSMTVTVWTLPGESVEHRRAAQALAIGFLERTLEAMRRAELS